jgi:poly(glycerol-phosphate) alpha-glucosyltransferase
VRTPIAVIPNGVTLPDMRGDLPRPAWMPADRRVLLFLGRIHRKKGVFELLDAWRRLLDRSEAVKRGWVLAIAGWDDGGYAAQLKHAAEDLALGPDSVIFPGGIFGREKEAAFRHASAFILPSYSEGLPMSILEAWSYGLPVLMTRGCNIPAAFDRDAAIEISTEPSDLSRQIERAMTSPSLGDVARNGRRFVEERFTWKAVINDLRAVYQWLAGTSSRPACVDS